MMKMHLWALVLLASCVRGPVEKSAPAPVAAAKPAVAVTTPRPSWVESAPFVISNEDKIKLYATGSAPVPNEGACPDPPRLIEVAVNRARAALLRGQANGSDFASGTVGGVESVAAWFDGNETVHVLLSMPVDAAPKDAGESTLESLTGDRPLAIGIRILEDARTRLEATGACKDPTRRAALPCCGPPDEMCHDKTRFDTTAPATKKCTCGTSAPCLDDFRCQAGKCVCKGAKCPCDILNCKDGQQCGDNRCY